MNVLRVHTFLLLRCICLVDFEHYIFPLFDFLLHATHFDRAKRIRELRKFVGKCRPRADWQVEDHKKYGSLEFNNELEERRIEWRERIINDPYSMLNARRTRSSHVPYPMLNDKGKALVDFLSELNFVWFGAMPRTLLKSANWSASEAIPQAGGPSRYGAFCFEVERDAAFDTFRSIAGDFMIRFGPEEVSTSGKAAS